MLISASTAFPVSYDHGEVAPSFLIAIAASLCCASDHSERHTRFLIQSKIVSGKI